MKDKAWYQSKTVWAGLVIAAVGLLNEFGIPIQYVELIYSVAAALGLYGLRDAVGKLK